MNPIRIAKNWMSYRRTMSELGNLSNQALSDIGITRYEIAKPDSHHDHLVCLDCGKIVEICDPRIEKLQREMAEKYGFKLRGHVHNLYGICKDCRDKAAKDD